LELFADFFANFALAFDLRPFAFAFLAFFAMTNLPIKG
jgi:hypothetical protein